MISTAASGDLSETEPDADSRLVDPISVEDNNNDLTQSDLIDIANYGDKNGKGYRYGLVIFHGGANPPPTFGMGPGGKTPSSI